MNDNMRKMIIENFFFGSPELSRKSFEILTKKAKENDPLSKQILAYFVYNQSNKKHLKTEMTNTLIESLNKNDLMIPSYLDYFISIKKNLKIEVMDALIKSLNKNDLMILPYLDYFISTYCINSSADNVEIDVEIEEEIAVQSVIGKINILGKDAFPDLVEFIFKFNTPIKFKEYILKLSRDA